MPSWTLVFTLLIVGMFAATWSVGEWLCRRMEMRNRNALRRGTEAANRKGWRES